MRGREEEANAGRTLKLNVVVELGAVVSGDGLEALRVPTHEPQSPSIGMFFGSRSEFADQDVTGFAVDEGHEAVLIPRADDGVDFPVANLGAKLGGEGSLADVSLAGETSAAVVSAVAFAAPFSGTAKVRIERSAEHAITPDVAVDRFMADAQRVAQLAADLFRAPLFAKQSFDRSQIGAREALITS